MSGPVKMPGHACLPQEKANMPRIHLLNYGTLRANSFERGFSKEWWLSNIDYNIFIIFLFQLNYDITLEVAILRIRSEASSCSDLGMPVVGKAWQPYIDWTYAKSIATPFVFFRFLCSGVFGTVSATHGKVLTLFFQCHPRSQSKGFLSPTLNTLKAFAEVTHMARLGVASFKAVLG
ncbi:uncharacterized protein Dsimw501_GD26786, isoform A [Drosophila simulans]|uniref:Uncharacterized protein, isoform A n=1 Tax=Drosophila simulans TaxID=7240 RepID=A0A0J9R666_DROSI|nr:uncharacterized protein Dsimw501_GD26786, isoform A [Drosophila simulans]